MVIQQLQTVKCLLEQDPPDVKGALFELGVAMQVAIQEYEKYHAKEPPAPMNFNWDEPIRPNDALLKEFGW